MFLRQPLRQVLIYLVLVLLFFTVLMFCERLRDSAELDGYIARSYWAVSFLCFLVASFLAVLTRPV
jgi:hypothetical protein